MQQLEEFFSGLFDTTPWPARWYCGEWSTFHGWLYIISDLLIWGAYMAIPLIMLYFALKKNNKIPFVNVYWFYMLFILACGTTHLIDALLFWEPIYRFGAIVLLLTGIVSWVAAYKIFRIIPDAMNLKSPIQLEKIVNERTLELKQTNKRLIKTNEDLDNFIYAASHDLKSPLTNIEGIVNILNKELSFPNETSKELFDKLKDSINQVRSNINSLSEVAKVQKNPYADIREINIEKVIDTVIKENEETINNEGITIKKQLDIKTVTFSKVGFKSIMSNLITNAIKYRSEKRKLTIIIKSEEKENFTIMSIEDNGMGIDLSLYKDKIFKIFNRFHDHVEGTGIGLYTVSRLIENSGGTINVESEVDKGTTFILKFNKNLAL